MRECDRLVDSVLIGAEQMINLSIMGLFFYFYFVSTLVTRSFTSALYFV